MEFRQFGRTGLKVSAIGFGCWEIGGTYGHVDEIQFQRAVHAAIDTGITCFDTAEAYGMGISEEALARSLAGRRNGVVIATKFGVGYEEMPNRRDSSRARVLASIDLYKLEDGEAKLNERTVVCDSSRIDTLRWP
jgi:aryl-alcohol dehydrogenase-like predicted oxidoreductase